MTEIRPKIVSMWSQSSLKPGAASQMAKNHSESATLLEFETTSQTSNLNRMTKKSECYVDSELTNHSTSREESDSSSSNKSEKKNCNDNYQRILFVISPERYKTSRAI